MLPGCLSVVGTYPGRGAAFSRVVWGVNAMNDGVAGPPTSDARPASRALQALSDTAARPFSDARSMPPEIYTSADVQAVELERLFRREWICVGRASAIAEPGTYLTYEIAGQPVIIVRDRTGNVRAFSNVCLHRMSVLLEGRGRTSVIVCPYHAWSYGLDGALLAAPHMERTPGFCKADYRLPELRTEFLARLDLCHAQS